MAGRIVCVGPPDSNVTGAPLVPGVSNSMQWRPGGIPGSVPFPMNISCSTVDEAQCIWTMMQPWTLAVQGMSREQQIAHLKSDANMRSLGHLLDQVASRVYWTVRLGSHVGIYFNGHEAMTTMDNTAQAHFRRAFAFNNFMSAVEGMISPRPAKLQSLHDYYPSKHPVAADSIRSEVLGLDRQGSDASEQPPPVPSAHADPVPTPSMHSPQPVHASPAPTPTTHTLPTPVTPSQIITVSPVIEVTAPATPSSSSRNGSSSRQGTPSRRGATVARSTPARRREIGERAQHYFDAHGWDSQDINEVDEILSDVRNKSGFVNRMDHELDVDRKIAEYVWSVLDSL
ncbi:hypothetical protein K435DRAFT_866429 [Dendrothele bispora CBS 962.96]|uniref:Uncharacterized protein n=1 Tax=Dendrothele bispora (strain CBS 962.96) TaxID=1314807 RepID=A0A4S8LH79_DENBC|nr:hypothetical protein K435DRAFT_866429 [Dendrothele bispora CBS 962.96]